MTRQIHGGDRYRNEIRLDFSVNTNPLGIPGYVKGALEEAVAQSADLCLEAYPDPVCGRLRAAIAARCEMTEDEIVCGNGAAELICAVVNAVDRGRRFFSAGRVGPSLFLKGGGRALRALLPVPSFAEYERALRAARADIVYHTMREEDDFALTDAVLRDLTPDIDLLILCNPNNPAGNVLPEPLLSAVLDRCRELAITVLLDECFSDLVWTGRERTSRLDLLRLAKSYPNVVVLRALTKLYAMPGLRLGFCAAKNPKLLRAVREQLPCWNVSGVAQIAGVTALDNENSVDYIGQYREMIVGERLYLTEGLERLGARVVPGCANFICFFIEPDESGGSVNLYEKLLRRGILIRDCGGFRGMREGWYRIAVRPHGENEILLREIGGLLSER